MTSSFAEQQAAWLRKQQYAREVDVKLSSVQLPLTPPSTPPTQHDSTFYSDLMVNIETRSTVSSGMETSSGLPRERHGYHAQQTPGLTPDSPTLFELPPLLREDTGNASDEETGIVTPPCNPSTSSSYPSIDIDPHTHSQSLLYSLSIGATPNLRDDASTSLDSGFKSTKFLLPSRIHTHNLPKHSPPHTPKGHPLTDRSKFQPLSSAAAGVKKNFYSIVNPYTYSSTHIGRSWTKTLAYLFRVPRRFRPLIMLGFCFLTFIFVYISRSTSDAQLETQAKVMAISRRYIDAVAEMPRTMSPLPTGAITAFKNKEEEYAALISFVSSTEANSLPPLDPLQPLDPSAVLDFDPHGAGARDDLDLLTSETHAIYPLVLMGNMRDPWNREIKKMLAEYKITPSPLVIDVDQRRDHLLFIPLISRLLGTTELPQLLLQGKSLGSYHDLLELKDSGKFVETLEQSGAVSVKIAKKKKKGIKEAQREENERILGPQPIVDGR